MRLEFSYLFQEPKYNNFLQYQFDKITVCAGYSHRDSFFPQKKGLRFPENVAISTIYPTSHITQSLEAGHETEL